MVSARQVDGEEALSAFIAKADEWGLPKVAQPARDKCRHALDPHKGVGSKCCGGPPQAPLSTSWQVLVFSKSKSVSSTLKALSVEYRRQRPSFCPALLCAKALWHTDPSTPSHPPCAA